MIMNDFCFRISKHSTVSIQQRQYATVYSRQENNPSEIHV